MLEVRESRWRGGEQGGQDRYLEEINYCQQSETGGKGAEEEGAL